jgi:hypothetical protein
MNETKSSKSTNKWLLGCGIGCGVVVFILVILGVGGYFFVKNIVQGFKDSEAIMDSLTAKYGKIKEYCPDPEGAIRPERLEAFLSVRRAFASVRQQVEKSFEILSKGKSANEIKIKSPQNVFSMVKLGFGVVPQIADFFKSRNQALMDAGMGMGEYYFIYVVAYYSWLKKTPEDGPDFELLGREEKKGYWDKDEVLEARKDRVLRRVQRMILPMLQNQFGKLTSGNIAGAQIKWREALAAEIKAMEADRFRLPWQDGLPEVIEASLKPFRERLEASYSRTTNALELALEQR